MNDTGRKTGPLVQGYLSRRIMGGNMKSKKKWFILTGRRLLSFKNQQDYENDNVFLDCIDLMDLQSARSLTSEASAKNTFELVTRTKSIVFQTSSHEKSEEWIEALRRVMMLRFSESADLPEEESETRKIEHELMKRKSTLKFWRSSLSSPSPISEDDAINSAFDFLESQETGKETEDVEVFKDEEDSTKIPSADIKPISTDIRPISADMRPVSASSGVDSASVEETSDNIAPASSGIESASVEETSDNIDPTAPAHSEDEGISDEPEDLKQNGDTFEPLYQNLPSPTKPPIAPRKLSSTPAIEELKRLVNYDGRRIGNESATELKNIEQLRELLAGMP